MWRQIRRLQQGIKSNLCLQKSDLHLKNGKCCAHNPTCQIAKLLPGALQNLNRILQPSSDSHSQSNKEEYEENTKNISQHTFLEAFGWSGAIVFGWVISKQWWFKQRWTQERDSCNDRTTISQCNQNLLKFLAHIVKTQPPVTYVLPHRPPTSSVQNSPKLNVVDEFEAAAKELQEVHNRATAEALNRQGIACLSKSDSEALKYFQRASDLKYSAASFNMGQCCELGIGTKQDFEQAAKWYKIASEQGHATAMYNLGVFYAHGWGGLKSDVSTAKNLFVKAAQLGQPDAKEALVKESKSFSNLYKSVGQQIPLTTSTKCIKEVHMNSTNLDFFIDKIRTGLADDVFQRGLSPEENWKVTYNSTVAI